MGQYDAILNEVQNVENFFEGMENCCVQMEGQWKQVAEAMKQANSWNNWQRDEATGTHIVGGELSEAKQILRNYLQWLQETYNAMFNNLDQMSGSFNNIINYLPDYIEHLNANKENCDAIITAKNDVILEENFFVDNNLANYIDIISNDVAATYAIGYNKALYKNISKISVKMNGLFKACLNELKKMIKFCSTSDPQAFAIGENAPSPTDGISIASSSINKMRYYSQKMKLKHWIKTPPKFPAKFRKITKSINKLDILIEAYHEVYMWTMLSMKGGDKKKKMKFVFNYVYGQFPYMIPCVTLSDAGKNFKHLVKSYYEIQTKGDPNNHISFRQYMEMNKLIKKYLQSDMEAFLMPSKQTMSGMYTSNGNASVYANVIANGVTKGTKVGCFFLRILSFITLVISFCCLIFTIAAPFTMEEELSTTIIMTCIFGVITLVTFNYGYKWWKKSNPFTRVIYKALEVSCGKKANSDLYNLCVQQLSQSGLSKIQFQETPEEE